MSYVDRAYYDLLQKVLKEGESRSDRTGVGTRSLFGEHIEVPLDPFPIVQWKKTFFRGVVEELLWFLRGSTNVGELQDKGVHIWDGNASQAYLRTRGLDSLPKNELGPIYGWQWRTWGKPYYGTSGSKETATTLGIDQVKIVLDLLRHEPHSRRILIQAWNVSDLDQMALPPCHIMSQFYVRRPSGTSIPRLDCHVYQRSCDIGLGLPFNLASYALLTHLFAHMTGYTVGKLRISFGDVHVYETHVDTLQNLPPPTFRGDSEMPRLEITCPPRSDPSEYTYEDFLWSRYEPGPSVTLPMAV